MAGVDPTNETTGLITKSQLVKGTWFTSNPADEVLVNTAYASTKGLKVSGTVTINSKSYRIVGLVSPTLTGNVADIYFPLSTMQSLASAPGYVNEVLVSVKSASEVAAVTAAIKKELPGATVLTSKSLADSVTRQPQQRPQARQRPGRRSRHRRPARRVPDRRPAHPLERRQARP